MLDNRRMASGVMRIFKTLAFSRFARQSGLSDEALRAAIRGMERGLIDADRGGGVFKQRIARAGGGKSGGFRAIIVLRTGDRAVFVYGFAKSERETLRPDELTAFRLLAAEMLRYDDAAIAAAVAAGVLVGVRNDG